MGKGNCPYQSKQAKYNQGDANPVNSFVGGVLVVFGVFVKVDIYGPPVSSFRSLRFFGCRAIHTSNIKCYFDPPEKADRNNIRYTYFANATDLVSLITVTFIWPG